MGKSKNFESVLPDGYETVYTIDAKDNKIGLLFNLLALVIIGVIVCLSFLVIRPTGFFENYSIFRNLLFMAAMFCYIILHELVHGLAYKAFTHQKLKFGLSLTVAYCGVPDIYVYRRTAMISLLAPFVVFIPVFLLPTFILDNVWDKFYCMILFALHIGGCVGDLYDTFLYLFKFRNPSTLMRDTGPMQTFYCKKQ